MTKTQEKLSDNSVSTLFDNIKAVHTTYLGVERIKSNLKIEEENVVEFCKKIILNKYSKIYKQGKNWYCINKDIIITINSYSFTIITAHKMKQKKN